MKEKKEKKEKNKKKKRVVYVDDGHTVYDMSGLSRRGENEKNNVGLEKKEKWAAIRAAFAVYTPMLLLVLAAFGLAMLIIFFWLK